MFKKLRVNIEKGSSAQSVAAVLGPQAIFFGAALILRPSDNSTMAMSVSPYSFCILRIKEWWFLPINNAASYWFHIWIEYLEAMAALLILARIQVTYVATKY